MERIQRDYAYTSCMCAHVHTHACSCTYRGQTLLSDIFLRRSLPYVLRQNLSLAVSARLAGQRAPGTFLSPHPLSSSPPTPTPSCRARAHYAWLFMWGLKMLIQGLMLRQQARYWSHLPTSMNIILSPHRQQRCAQPSSLPTPTSLFICY